MLSNKKHNDFQMPEITTGPFLIPLETDCEYQVGRDNDRIIIILKNPTSKRLRASVKLGVCLQPQAPMIQQDGLRVFKNIPEKDYNLGTFELKPHTCTRIERDIPEACLLGKDERNAVYRISAKGDFKISDRTGEPVCGLLEISVVGGSIFNPSEPGLEQADSATLFRYKDFTVCEGEDCWC
ncbi:hypothetical protein J7I93_13050 [Bacillus sp. ISL-47]|uniref:hypothetical protein n=1 Tax=Bacillus sp. ISL-47 TaxID=2819130 RepID=UPI001BE637DC|nr:hypothetical protein [Bacillus sp. ISL-47]MBT2689113.1 hypothetical protein [Bacillus sp. ISL-47]MBT2708569.1 hypothetical protein [Pseudomonas sp. ISL-84]